MFGALNGTYLHDSNWKTIAKVEGFFFFRKQKLCNGYVSFT